MNRISPFLALLLLLPASKAWSSPPVISPYIKIDQFGYYPASKKMAVIADPQNGYNAAESFAPGTGVNNYQVRRWADDVVVYSGTLSSWNGGATQTQSGDRGWWFDFTSLTTTGSYYIFDAVNNVGSYRFEISNTAYADVLKQAVRMFYYQRINFAKATPFADSRWVDGAAFEGSNQDRFARSRYAKNDATTAKDLHGGWMDAGDYNKYTTFTFAPLCGLLETYRIYPDVFGDNFSIPESGNGIPDLLDELKYEIDWLIRMQDASGTNGLYLKVGADNYNAASPPSTDINPRYYLGECTSSTLTGAAVFALASIVYRTLGTAEMITYADDLLTRAQSAWTRAQTTTSNFTSFQTTCDDQDIKAGDADVSAAEQMDRAITAAAYLFEATGLASYKTAFESMYASAQPYSSWWWGPYYTAVQRAMLRYARLAGVSATVANNIISMKSNQNGVLSITDYNNATDLYRAYMPDAQYHWGSNEVKGYAGIHNFDYVNFNINTASHSLYKETAESYLHWFHGLNPMGKTMLTNMYAFGGDNCADEMYHSWFTNGSQWDNAISSLKGPAPGYVHGGPDKDYPVTGVIPPYNQPPQKSYKDWNTTWNGSYDEISWRITEPSIYAQAAYIGLLARVMGSQPAVVLPVRFLRFEGKRNTGEIVLSWEIATDEQISGFELQRSFDGQNFSLLQSIVAKQQTNYTLTDPSNEASIRTVYYRVKVLKTAGGILYSTIIRLPLKITFTAGFMPNPVKDILQLRGTVNKEGSLQLQVFDITGRSVINEQWLQTTGSYTRTIYMSTLSPGLYLVRLTDGSLMKEYKVIRQ